MESPPPPPIECGPPNFFDYAEAMESVLNHLPKPVMFTGELFPAADMAQIGLVTRVFRNDGFEEEVQKVAEKIAGKSPLGLKRMKQLLEGGMDMPLENSYINGEVIRIDAGTRAPPR